jgi:hypothetical protein
MIVRHSILRRPYCTVGMYCMGGLLSRWPSWGLNHSPSLFVPPTNSTSLSGLPACALYCTDSPSGPSPQDPPLRTLPLGLSPQDSLLWTPSSGLPPHSEFWIVGGRFTSLSHGAACVTASSPPHLDLYADKLTRLSHLRLVLAPPSWQIRFFLTKADSGARPDLQRREV